MHACMYIFMNTNCRWFYEKCKKNIWENAELKVKKICTGTCGFKFNNKYLGSWIYNHSFSCLWIDNIIVSKLHVIIRYLSLKPWTDKIIVVSKLIIRFLQLKPLTFFWFKKKIFFYVFELFVYIVCILIKTEVRIIYSNLNVRVNC